MCYYIGVTNPAGKNNILILCTEEEISKDDFESQIKDEGEIIEVEKGEDYIIEGDADDFVIEEQDLGVEIEIVDGKVVVKENPIIIASPDADVDLVSVVEMAAFQAEGSGDGTEFNELLTNAGLKDDFERIEEKYEVNRSMKTLNTRTRRSYNTEMFRNDEFRTGDIVLRHGKKWTIPGEYKHGGLLNKKRAVEKKDYCIFSASGDADASRGLGGSCVGYERASKWIEKSPNKIGVFRVKGTSVVQGEKALAHIEPQRGKKYAVVKVQSGFYWRKIRVRKGWVKFTIKVPAWRFWIVPVNRTSTDKYYCTKVVWQAWKSQGKDVEWRNWSGIKGPWVTPADIGKDGDTERIAGN